MIMVKKIILGLLKSYSESVVAWNINIKIDREFRIYNIYLKFKMRIELEWE